MRIRIESNAIPGAVKMRAKQTTQATVAAAVFLLSSMVHAQATIEPPIVNPGARSLGLGGAFVAVADDATAAWANPSGLMQLVRPEISAELRSWSENREGVATNLSSLGFASFVLPRKHWSLAIYVQTMASLEFPDEWDGNDEIEPLSSLAIVNGGISFAFRLGDDVSLGVGLTVFAGSFSGADFSNPDSNPFWSDDISTEPGATAGLLWTLSDAWAVGASYRSGADFQFSNGPRATVPDVLAAGGRWRSTGGNATVAAELEQLNGIDTRTRLHLGGEWVFLSAKPLIGLRAGLWYDPSGGVAAAGSDLGPTLDDGVMHYSAGIGVAWKKFQLDLGADFSDRTTIASISGIFTF